MNGKNRCVFKRRGELQMYAIGDFVLIRLDGDEHVGVIALKQKKEKHLQEIYWFNVCINN